MNRSSSGQTGNRLLSVLAPADRALLTPFCEAVDLPLGTRLVEAGEPIGHVYFLDSGLGSDMAFAEEGDRPVECGLVGREGLIGLPVVLGSDRGAHASDMQVGGGGLRIESQRLRDAMAQSPTLRDVLLRYAYYFMVHTAQTAACNARHSLGQRLARWLLMSQDRLGDMIPLTHDYLAIMLGVRRAGVTQALHILEGEHLIKAVRGQIRVQDRAGLEKASCACYGIVNRELNRVMGDAAPSRPGH